MYRYFGALHLSFVWDEQRTHCPDQAITVLQVGRLVRPFVPNVVTAGTGDGGAAAGPPFFAASLPALSPPVDDLSPDYRHLGGDVTDPVRFDGEDVVAEHREVREVSRADSALEPLGEFRVGALQRVGRSEEHI